MPTRLCIKLLIAGMILSFPLGNLCARDLTFERRVRAQEAIE
jgi:hypothetical protein